MNLRNVWWQYLVLLGCCCNPVAYADENVLLGLNDQLAVLAELDAAVADVTALQEGQTPKYWLGLLCIDVGEPLRAQLGLEEGAGLLIDAVTDGTPAKQAGLQRHDVLIVAQPASQPLGDQVKQLKSPTDLVEAVQSVETKPLRLVLFRQGQRKEIEVAPVERNNSDSIKVEVKLTTDQELPNPLPQQDLTLRLAGPLIAFQSVAPALPEGMTIEFRQVVSQPERILVTKGDEKWEVTEPELGKLPEPVRMEVLRQIVARRSAPIPFVLTNPPALPGAPVAPVPPVRATTKAYVNEYNVAKSVRRAVDASAVPAAGNTAITFTTKLPDDVTVKVERKGSEPVKATVKKGEQTWVLGEKGLDQLPEDVRKVVAPVWAHSMSIASASDWGPRKFVVAEDSMKARDAAIAAKKKAETAAEWISKAEVQRIEAMHRAVDAQRKLKEDDIVTLRETMDRARREMREERESLRQQKEELSRQTKELHESIDKLRQRLDRADRADKD